MKRTFTFLLAVTTCILMALPSVAQTQPASRMTNPWWWGVNFGATWQTSDMKTIPGFGWGITASKFSRYRENRALWWGARFRFLDGVNYGEDYNRFKGITNDNALNGVNNPGTNGNPLVNYTTNGGYIFSNYRMHMDELSFDLLIGSNGLRKHGILLYGWGGLGISKTSTKINQLDGNGNMYNYSTIDSTGNKGVVQSQLHNMWDNTYETKANGSEAPGWTFMPSVGIGFGKTFFNERLAISLEHKLTFSLDKIIDGRSYDNANLADAHNDWYHYTGVSLIWRFSSVHERTLPPPPDHTDPNTYSTVNPNTNPNNNPNTNPNNTTTTVNTNPNNNPNNPNNPQNQQMAPPIVRVTVPAQNPYYTNIANGQLTAQVLNVLYQNQIQLTVNGFPNSNFSWNASTHMMTVNYGLQPGNNVFNITATNQVGSDMGTETIVLNQQAPPNNGQLPPQVTITNPPTNPYTSTVSSMTVYATVLNVASSSNIMVRRNGSPITNFTYNGSTHQVTFPASLQTGSNLFEVIGTNTVGSATGSVTIIYNTVTPPTGVPPVITITNPSTCPTMAKVQNMTITATIMNVTMASEIGVSFNNQVVTNFSWNNATKQLSFPVTLIAGSNHFTITATNAYGKDIKACDITYKASLPAPTVTITNPPTNPYSTSTAPLTLNATVLNVNSQNEITMTMNNQPVSNFSYNMSNHVLTFNTTLNPGTTVFTVTAANAGGSDSKSETVVYTPPAPQLLPPVVTITIPSVNPFITSSPNVSVTATVLNVSSSSQIQVNKLAGPSVNFSFNPSTHILTFSDVITPGAMVYTITATNAAGSDSKSTTIKLVQSGNGTGASGTGSGSSGGSTGVTGSTGGVKGGGGGSLSGSTGGTGAGGHGTVSVGTGPSSGTSTSSGSTGSSSSSSNPPTPSDPVITLVTPSTNSYATNVNSIQVVAHITGITTASEAGVRVNGVRLMGATFTNGTLTFTANLNSGVNTIEIKAQNQIGMANQTITVTYTPASGSKGSGGTSGKGTTSTPKTTTTTTTTPKTTTTPATAPEGKGTSTTPKTTTTPRATSGSGKGGQ